MPLNSQKVSKEIPEEGLGSLGGCLVEGDPEQRSRERHVRRRSLMISILIQTALLAVLVMLPMFAKTEHIALAIATPLPPYGHPPHRTGGTTKQSGDPGTSPYKFPSPIVRPIAPSQVSDDPAGPPDIGSGENDQTIGPGCSWCIDIGGKNSGPRPPQPVVEKASKPRVIKTTIDPAMLIRRVEPIYPPLARQIHREGRVELRAIIATDGTIQSLQVVAGDPIFYQSAIDAVSQWRYKPTVLNGQPVEIDTYITVIYIVQY